MKREQEWEKPYLAAVLESDRGKWPKRIKDTCRSQPKIFISASFVPSLFGWIPQSLLGPLLGRRRYHIQTDARVVVLDLTERHAIGGGGLGMLVILQRWAQDHDIRFKLFNPSRPVRDKLKHVDLEIATLEQIMSILSRVNSKYARALIESQFPLHQLSEYA